MMLDSGSSVSLIQKDVLSRAQDVGRIKATKPLRLVTASGDQLPILDHVSALVQVGELHVRHEFVVTESLVAPVILGVDFLHEDALLLDFTKAYVQVRMLMLVQTHSQLQILQGRRFGQSMKQHGKLKLGLVQLQQSNSRGQMCWTNVLCQCIRNR